MRSTAGMRAIVHPRAYDPMTSSMPSRCEITPSTSDCANSDTGGASAPAMRRASTSCGSSPRASDSNRMSSARFRALDREPFRAWGAVTSAAHAAQVAPGAGVHLDLRAGLQEQRDLDLRTGGDGGGLGASRGAVALQAGVGLGDLELDRGRELDVERGAVVERHLDLLVLQEEAGLVADRLLGDRDLLVVRGVHEDEVGAVAVEVGHVAAVDVRGLDLGAGVERLVDHL